jgi:hypothetical protein
MLTALEILECRKLEIKFDEIRVRVRDEKNRDNFSSKADYSFFFTNTLIILQNKLLHKQT